MQTVSERPLVLIVDDFEDGRKIYAEYLSFRNYRVETAGDGVEALAKTVALLPSVVLMDIGLPILDGLAATQQIKADARTRHIPVIALTAHAMHAARVEAIAAGCSAVVTKPCVPREVETEIRRQLGGRGEGRREPRRAPRNGAERRDPTQ